MSPASLAQLPRFFRTVRHLRLSQVGWRLRYLVQRRLETQSWYGLPEKVFRRIEGMHVAPSEPHCRPWQRPAISSSDRLAELQAGRLTLLNQQLPFAGGEDWCMRGGRTADRLWRYHLHYHEWLVDLADSYRATGNDACLAELRRWLSNWMSVCRAGEAGFTHYPWNSYTIAQRLWHWREIAALVPQNFWNDEDLSHERFLQSVAAQAGYLSQHIEWDLRGNHLFKDAVGLAAAAALLGVSAPPTWVAQANAIALSQVAEQILPDGMHFERSPMYHIHVLEDLLALRALLRDERTLEVIEAACRKMAEPLRWLMHPCGVFPMFNDAADQQVSRPMEMAAALQEMGGIASIEAPTGLRYFDAAGLVAWHGSPWTVFFDVGDVGPDYQPGHAHADSLTIELSFQGERLVVDPGTVCYDHDDRRRYDRSTSAHNSVCIDETNSSEVWHIFRVGRRAKPVDVFVVETEEGFKASATHTGYDQLPGSPRHHRRMQLVRNARLEIQEEITGVGRHHVEGGFLLAPDWTATLTEYGWSLRHETHRLKIELHSNQPVKLSIVNRPWHPEFGKEVTTQRLVWSGDVSPPFRLRTAWQPV